MKRIIVAIENVFFLIISQNALKALDRLYTILLLCKLSFSPTGKVDCFNLSITLKHHFTEIESLTYMEQFASGVRNKLLNNTS